MASVNTSTLCYIQEQTSFPDDYKEKFGYEVHQRTADRFYLTFPAILQSFGVLNRNKRVYLADNIMDHILHSEYIQTMLKHNSWMGEIDHPSPVFKGEELTVNRIVNPDLKLSSHYIRSPRLCGNLLKANIQTDSSNEYGMNMAIKILDGKIVPSFSARVLGELRMINGQPTVYVTKLVTYDWVAFASHREADGLINQPHMESAFNGFEHQTGCKIIPFKELAQRAANNSKETQLLCESFGMGIDDVVGLTDTGDSIVLHENGNVYSQFITSKEVRTKTQSILSDWLSA